MLCPAPPGAVAVSIVEAVEPVPQSGAGRGTSDCRYEHELQIRFSPRSLPGGSISVIVRKEDKPQLGISLQLGRSRRHHNGRYARSPNTECSTTLHRERDQQPRGRALTPSRQRNAVSCWV